MICLLTVPNDSGNYTILKGEKLDILLQERRPCTYTEIHIHRHEQTQYILTLMNRLEFIFWVILQSYGDTSVQ